MRKKHGSVPKLHTCLGLDSHNEQKHWHSKCHYKRNSGSVPAGTNNPTRLGKPRSDRGPTGGPPPPDPATATTTPAPGDEAASAAASGQVLRQKDSHPRQVDALLRLPTRPAWRPRPTRHATGAPDATCKQLHRHLRHHRASSVVEPIPRLEATQRTTQQRQPGATVNAAESGPAVMTVAGGRGQRSRRQPSSRPIWGQQESPLSRREDNAPVIRSSNGSRTRNGRPANHSPRRINSAAGQATLLAGEAGDASPSP
jgi:hypothetical protein